MARRRYRMDKRADAATETRRRIVEACFALHARQGISGTTMTQIAERAGVSIGTVYHHFPAYEDAIAACGAFTSATIPPPGAGIFDRVAGLEERIDRLAAAIFGYFERLDTYALIRSDRHRYEAIDTFVRQEEKRRLALMRSAVELFGFEERDIRLAAALLDVAVHDELRQAGFSTAQAAAEVAAMVCAGLTARCPNKSP